MEMEKEKNEEKEAKKKISQKEIEELKKLVAFSFILFLTRT